MNKFFKITNFVLLPTLVFSTNVFSFSCKINIKDKNNYLNLPNKIGTWIWDYKKITNKHLEFAQKNNIKEIYVKVYKIGQNEKKFLDKLKQNNFDIYLLLGKKEWINNSKELKEKIEWYKNVQKEFNYFKGIHLDIEPHQYTQEFKNLEKRRELLTKFVNLIYELKTNYSNVKFDYDIPFWFKDLITFNNQTKKVYEHIIDNSNRVFIMSYRDKTNKILDISKEIINYAKNIQKEITLSVNTQNLKNEKNTYFFNKQHLKKELLDLSKKVSVNINFAIHHLDTWFNLKESDK